MRKIYRKTLICLGVISVASISAQAQTNPAFDNNASTILVPSSSSSYNQQGFNLPTAPRGTGQDIVRGSGGISCHSSISGNGPVLDLGVIGTNDIYSRDSTAMYGRITVPLGKKPKRVDCTKLYDLEIARLKMELKLMRAGSMGGFDDMAGARQALYGHPQITEASDPNLEELIAETAAPFEIPMGPTIIDDEVPEAEKSEDAPKDIPQAKDKPSAEPIKSAALITGENTPEASDSDADTDTGETQGE